MRKIVFLLLISFVGTYAFSQDPIEPKYTLKGDLIAVTMYHDNGVVSQKGFYTEDGKLQGEWTSFDAEGNKTATAFYEKGEKVGTWTFYNGDEMKVVDFTDARVSQVKTWKVTDTRVVSY